MKKNQNPTKRTQNIAIHAPVSIALKDSQEKNAHFSLAHKIELYLSECIDEQDLSDAAISSLKYYFEEKLLDSHFRSLMQDLPDDELKQRIKRIVGLQTIVGLHDSLPDEQQETFVQASTRRPLFSS
jgi:hypothetical protein